MAIFHVATNTPPKSELVAAWIADQPWGPPAGEPIELLASFHLDDPDGEVGMQVFAVSTAEGLMQVPLTYRAAPEPELADALIGVMQHSVLGPRYVYDGVRDERFLTVLAGVAACGYGQALGFAEHDGRWYAVPDEMLLCGTGALQSRVAADGLHQVGTDHTKVVLANDGLELTIFRRLGERDLPAVGLTATWPKQASPLVLVEVRQL